MSNAKLVLITQEKFSTEYSKTLYFVGVSHGNILVYDSNPATGAVENRRIFALAPEPSRSPGFTTSDEKPSPRRWRDSLLPLGEGLGVRAIF